MTIGELLESLKGIDPSTPVFISGSFCEGYDITGVYYDGQGTVSIDIETTNEGESA
jgi:hypothetical protein